MSSWLLLTALVRARLVGALVLTAVALVALSSSAGAHAELTASSPAEGETVSGPLEHISLSFLNPVVAVEDQFALVDAGGQPVAIASIEPADETSSMHVVPAEPLDGGAYGLRWAARAGDSHPRVGSITFTVHTPAAAAENAPGTGTAEPAPETTGSSTGNPRASAAAHQTSDLHEALAPSDTGTASSAASLIRFFMYTGLLLSVGGILYLAFVHRGTRGEGRRLVFLVRRAALLTMVATVLELPVQAILVGGGSTDAIADPNAYSGLLGGDFGLGMLLRLVGAGLVLGGMRMQLDRLRDGSPSEAAYDDLAVQVTEPSERGGVATRARIQTIHSHRVRVDRSPAAMAGALALVGSELFIGHTASSEPRWLVLGSTAVHLVAAGLWVAGLAMLALTLWRRHRRGAELEAALLATRFSVAAIAAVAAVSVTGLALGIAILGDLGGLVSTEFGRLLLVKVVLVAVLVALGGYNQRIVIPSLERGRRARRAGHRLRRVVTAEVVTFLAIVAVTAMLVGADSTG